MFNNSSGQPQPPATGHDSNRSSRPSTNTPSSTLASALQIDTTLQENPVPVPDPRNQGRGQSNVRASGYGPPIPLLPIYWNGLFPAGEQGPASATGTPSRSDGYPSASPYGQPILPNFQTGQNGEYQGVYYTPAATTNPLPAGYSHYPLRPPPAVYTTPNAQGEPSAVWQSFCWIDRAERDEVRMTIVLRRSPPA